MFLQLVVELHLQEMGSTGGSLLETKPLRLCEIPEKPLTSIWYRQKLAKAWETSPEDIEQKKFAAAVAEANELTPEATTEAEKLVEELPEGYASECQKLVPWLAYSY